MRKHDVAWLVACQHMERAGIFGPGRCISTKEVLDLVKSSNNFRECQTPEEKLDLPYQPGVMLMLPSARKTHVSTLSAALKIVAQRGQTYKDYTLRSHPRSTKSSALWYLNPKQATADEVLPSPDLCATQGRQIHTLEAACWCCQWLADMLVLSACACLSQHQHPGMTACEHYAVWVHNRELLIWLDAGAPSAAEVSFVDLRGDPAAQGEACAQVNCYAFLVVQ